MKKGLLATLALALIIAAPLAAQDQTTEVMTLEKVVEMSKAGLSDETIINAVISSEASIVLTVKDILYLKEQGVSEDVINFLLRRQPQSGAEATEAVPAEEQGQQLPEYVADAAQGNYYDGYTYSDDYVYTDGYQPQDYRDDFIVYHYYGPWLRYYPWYFGFYYYPASYYYYSWWPDYYYYYFYYPRFSGWRHYYHYPFYYNNYHWGGRYYYHSGRYIRTRDGRYIDRWNRPVGSYAVGRGTASRVSRSGVTVRGRTSTTGRSAVYRGRTTSSRAPNVSSRYSSPSRSVRTPSRTPRTRSSSPPRATSSRSRSATPRRSASYSSSYRSAPRAASSSRSRVSVSRSSSSPSRSSAVRSSSSSSRSSSSRSSSSSSRSPRRR